MGPNEIEVGTEVFGACCTTAPGNNLIYSQGQNNGNWFYLGNNWTTLVNSPLVGYWISYPSGGSGGNWRTGCNGNGGAC